MKFGNYLKSRLSEFPREWASKGIEYESLKAFVKHSIIPHTLRLDSAQVERDPTLRIAEWMRGRGDTLLKAAAEFYDHLEDNLATLSELYNAKERDLLRRFENLDESRPRLLADMVALENFCLLQYTAVTKILKKFDKTSGLSGTYLSHAVMAKLHHHARFYTERKLRDAQQVLIQELNTSLTRDMANCTLGNIETTTARSTTVPHASLLLGNRSEEGVEEEGLELISQQADSNERSIHGGANNPALVVADPFSAHIPVNAAYIREGKALERLFPPNGFLPNQRILVTISGAHGTDIKQALLESLAECRCTIEDTSFSRLYHIVNYAVLIRLGVTSVETGIFQKLSYNARRWKASLKFDVYDHNAVLPASLTDAPYPNRVKHAATILNQEGLSTRFLSDFTSLLLRNRISVEKLGRLNAGKIMCAADYQLSVPQDTDIDTFRSHLFDLSGKHATDVAFQVNTVFRRSKRLVVFDMDSTLIQQEVVDEIAKYAGVVSQVAAITHRAMMGELDFEASLRERVSLLKGLPVKAIENVKNNITFTPGAHTLCRCLKRLGFKLAVISGGFIRLANYVKGELGLDYAFANKLEVTGDGKVLTGGLQGPIVTAERKSELMQVIAQAENIVFDQVVAIGDGANDLHMLRMAGLGIAFNAKPRVQKEARHRINQKSLASVLYLLGYSDEDVRHLVLS